jgi:hypothetical protein
MKWIPKVLNVLRVTKPVLVSVTWPHFIFRFFEAFCEHTSRNKPYGSTNFIFFGPMDQKLWMFENFRKSLDRAGMGWSQWGGVDQSSKSGGRRRKNRRQQGKNGAPMCSQQDRGSPAAAHSLIDCKLGPFFQFFLVFFINFFWGCLGMGLDFRRMEVQHSHFLNLAPILGRVKSSIPHGAWRFHFFPIFIFAKIFSFGPLELEMADLSILLRNMTFVL